MVINDKKQCVICNTILEYNMRNRKTCSDNCAIEAASISRAKARSKKKRDKK